MKMKMINFDDYHHYQLFLPDYYDFTIADDKLAAIKLFKQNLPKKLWKGMEKYVSRFWMRDQKSWR